MQDKILKFLYQQVSEKKIPQIRPGMVEDLEGFIEGILADHDAKRIANNMHREASLAQQTEDEGETLETDH